MGEKGRERDAQASTKGKHRRVRRADREESIRNSRLNAPSRNYLSRSVCPQGAASRVTSIKWVSDDDAWLLIGRAILFSLHFRNADDDHHACNVRSVVLAFKSFISKYGTNTLNAPLDRAASVDDLNYPMTVASHYYYYYLHFHHASPTIIGAYN